MSGQRDPVHLEDHSLNEVIQLLIAGVPVARSDGDDFRLDTDDKRKAFAFYNQNRDLWPYARTVQEKEVDGLLSALEGAVPTISPPGVSSSTEKPLWHLVRIEAHRFGGLHRHCGPDGEDPAPFILDLDAEVALVSGFNGAGKTALLSAIVWCLTGRALRSQHMPHEIHEPMTVEWADEESPSDDEETKPKVMVPPVVPVPSGKNLDKLGDQPKLDTWVRLTFQREGDAETHAVKRMLNAPSGKKLTTTVEGLKHLALPALAIEVGTLMPGVAAQMRFDEKTDFTQAVSQLTGMKPLEELGRRAQRLIDRLRKKENKATEEIRDTKCEQFHSELQRFHETWAQQPDLGTPPDILAPGEEETDDSGDDERTCQSSIVDAREGLRRTQEAMAGAVEVVLNRRLEVSTPQDVAAWTSALDEAGVTLNSSALGALPSVSLVKALGGITAQDVSATTEIIDDIRMRAQTLAKNLEDERAATRWQLYARVAAWHRDHHPDVELSNCPVCGTHLDDVPQDALLDMSVRAALEECRRSDADMAKTAAEWERDETAALLNRLPERVRGFADKTLPQNLLATYRQGFVEELLDQSAFSGRLQPLQDNGNAVWDSAVQDNPLPDEPAPIDSTLPDLFAQGTLQRRMKTTAQALLLAAHRDQANETLKALLGRYIGSSSAADESGSDGVAADGDQLRLAPLRTQIRAVRQGVENTGPIVQLIRDLDGLERVRQEWEAQKARLALLDRAAKAVEPYLEFPDLVYRRVSGLIETLDSQTGAWLDCIYRPHYLDGPRYGGVEPADDSGLGLRAGIDDMRVPAHQIMNTSLLRACVWAFLFSLVEHVRAQAGGLSCLLLDDPQTHFDPINSENLAAAIPKMPAKGIRPLVTSNDVRFVAAVKSNLGGNTATGPAWTALRLDPISLSRLTAEISPDAEEIRERQDRWRDDKNNVAKAQDFTTCVRVDIENRLWNLLATDPLVMHKPTLADLLGQLRGARTKGEPPFTEEPFQKLLNHDGLKDGAAFFAAINKAHHRPAEITPQDAADIDQVYSNVSSLLRSCTASYARFLGRLTREERNLVLSEPPPAPAAVNVSAQSFPVIGSLAARSASDMLAVDGQGEMLRVADLGPLTMFAIRGPSLGALALPGQIVMAALEREAREGDPVIALWGRDVFAGRLHKDPRDLSRSIVASDRSGTDRVPPTRILPTASSRIMPIVGVLYDAVSRDGQGDAVAIEASPALLRATVAARVIDDSAFPIIRNGDTVLLEEISDLLPGSLSALEGRIVAALGTDSGESFGYLKRLGQEPGPGLRLLENIGLTGSAVCMWTSSDGAASPGHLSLEKLWRVHGILRTA